MKQNSLFLYLLLAVLVIAPLSSCEDDDEVLPFMSGLTYNLPGYCYVGDSFDLVSGGITVPASGVSYYWKSSDDDILKDTIPGMEFTMHIPDTLGSYSITAFALAEGYSTATASRTVIAIDTTLNASVKDMSLGDDSFVDIRDGVRYYTAKIGNLHWFIQNLRYAGTKAAPVGIVYNNEDVLANVFGRLYTWEVATGGVTETGLGNGVTGICPSGWSIPTKEDWEDLGKVLNGDETIVYDDMWQGLGEKAMVEATINDDPMWSYSYKVKKTNIYKWNASPSGNSLMKDSRFENISLYGTWWSGTEASSTEASYRYIYYNNTFFAPSSISKEEFGASVRCVKKI